MSRFFLMVIDPESGDVLEHKEFDDENEAKEFAQRVEGDGLWADWTDLRELGRNESPDD